ncbi:MASE1 domain-containing protein [Geobacter pelophilus]|uniref:histidine kinase n=1 Tax=Geoanaerobacter pelophilus TaxID=60036 RepID=A0AAW4L148_9BACT|nr:MASE1 domain-containing protein [Geoanaerobacter pelophilus]MBT0664638.1 MASE1 domain-containing protein [Geoanaerobacter pelophilus]
MSSAAEKIPSITWQPGHFLPGLAQNIAVAVTYVVTAKLGFLLALDQTNATAVWPPTGVALAACLVFGLRLWPGIFLGAFLANILVVAGSTIASLPVLMLALSTAAGNTLEALVGAYLVNRFSSGRLPFDRTLDTVYFMLFGALVSPFISATVGTASFCSYSSDWSRFGQMWLTWWLGDAVGALIIAPLLLTWEKRGVFRRYRWQTAEAAALLAMLLLAELTIFPLNAPLEYLVFPLLFWTAFRFGQFEAAVMVMLVMVTFLLWTVSGLGPFAGKPLNNALLFLQSYLGVASASTLILSTLISTRNRAEASLREYQDNLEKLVTLRTAELQGANERLTGEIEERVRTEQELAVAKERAEAADNLKSAFLATMSHELRTPLNSIIGFTGILLQELGGPVNEEQAKQLNMVKNSANHLLSLISDVLDISKIEAGQATVTCVPVDLKTIIVKTVLSVRPLAEKKGLELTLDMAEDVIRVNADERRVEQILLNLLSNAVKFTEKGFIAVRCGAEAGNYVISVTDTGIGIRADDLERLFQPFQQIDTGLSRKYEGTGLGLSICKKMAELMGGCIQVESSLETGSTFSFVLPLERGSA